MTLGQLIIKILMELSGDSEKEVTNAVKSLRSKLTKLLSAIGITLSLKNINELLEQWNEVNKVVNNLNTELADQYELQDKICEAANNTRMAYTDMANYVNDLVKSGSKYFSTAEDAADFLEIANQLFQVSGATESEISSLNSVIKTTFTNGKLSASGFSTILSSCPELIDYLSESLGYSTETIKAMGYGGMITASQLYTAFTSNADAISEAYDGLSLTISDAVTIIKNKWGTWLSQMDQTYNLTDTIARLIVSAFDKVMAVLEKITAAFNKLSEILGSTEAAAKVLLGTIVALMAAFNATKIQNTYKALKSFYTLLSTGKLATFIAQLKSGTSVAKAFTSVFTNWKVVAIAAAIAAIVLLIKDLVNFANGEDSVIGSLFEKLGIDGENLRETIQHLMSVLSELMSILSELMNRIMTVIEALLEAICEVLGVVIEVVAELLAIVIEIVAEILEAVIPIIEALLQIIEPIVEIIKVLADILTGVLSEAFSYIADVIGYVIDTLNPFLELLEYIISFLVGVFTGDWEKAWKSLGNIVIAVVNGIIAAFESCINFFIDAVNTITQALSSLWTWLGIPAIPEIESVSLGRIAYLAEGGYVDANNPTHVIIGDNTQEGEIVSPISKMRDTVLEALSLYNSGNGAELTADDAYGMIADAISYLAGSLNFSGVQSGAQTLESQVSDTTINQNVYMYNTFEGTKEVQQQTSNAMKTSATDLVSALADAINYTR